MAPCRTACRSSSAACHPARAWYRDSSQRNELQRYLPSPTVWGTHVLSVMVTAGMTGGGGSGSRRMPSIVACAFSSLLHSYTNPVESPNSIICSRGSGPATTVVTPPRSCEPAASPVAIPRRVVRGPTARCPCTSVGRPRCPSEGAGRHFTSDSPNVSQRPLCVGGISWQNAYMEGLRHRARHANFGKLEHAMLRRNDKRGRKGRVEAQHVRSWREGDGRERPHHAQVVHHDQLVDDIVAGPVSGDRAGNSDGHT